jgi:hypothetical protein
MWVAVISENARSLDFARDDNFTGLGGAAEAVPFPNPGPDRIWLSLQRLAAAVREIGRK